MQIKCGYILTKQTAKIEAKCLNRLYVFFSPQKKRDEIYAKHYYDQTIHVELKEINNKLSQKTKKH
jgi:hypothetical protein